MSLADSAIANSRKHQDEVQTKADLEALGHASPNGVVVFDARVAGSRHAIHLLDYGVGEGRAQGPEPHRGLPVRTDTAVIVSAR